MTAIQTSSPSPAVDHTVSSVRRFNRFYTRRIGILDRSHLESPFSLAEVRVIYELAHWRDSHDEPATATAIGRELGLDGGYLSRILRKFERRGLVRRTAAPDDGRQQHLQLTNRGHTTFQDLDARAGGDIDVLLQPLAPADRDRLLDAMSTIQQLLGDPSDYSAATKAEDTRAFVLRDPLPGDLGWVVERHGAVYAAEYGWNEHFEGLVATIVGDYIAQFDPARDRCWIAERNGERVGSVFLVHHPEREGVAKLRLLLVEPAARGLGLGAALVAECTRFARQAGYHTITLWTNSVLVSARRLYEAEGYRLIEETPHTRFGPELIGQTWELMLED